MKNLPLKTIVEVVNGDIQKGTDDFVIESFVTRTKRLKQGALLFDLYHEENINTDSCPKGRSCAIVTDTPANFSGLGENITVIQVVDINEACWKFIEFYRSLFKIPVIGVTGTCGKTTTKEMIKHILSENYKVNATYKSYNALYRDLGYLLDIDDDTQAAVYEMGVASPGDLNTSCRYFKPQVGVITNIGIDHLQAFGTLSAYIMAKAEFLEGLGFEGTLILNADDENIKKIDLEKYKGNVITFGFDDQAYFKASNVQHTKGGLKFTLQYNDNVYNLFIPGYGEFNVMNATAAIAAAHAIGFDINEAGGRLASFRNVERHFEFNRGINGSTVIDDTWSTNPTSTEAALKLLKTLSQGKKTIAALGRMCLLGKRSSEYHYKIGEKVAEIGIDQLIAIGDGASEIGLGAIQKGMDWDSVYFCKDSDETYEVLKKALNENSISLVKTTMEASYADLMNKIIIRK
jgi:UDP-N-acetylmuramoyl-tripeptide--D-alanyl-D-alanine ligase